MSKHTRKQRIKTTPMIRCCVVLIPFSSTYFMVENCSIICFIPTKSCFLLEQLIHTFATYHQSQLCLTTESKPNTILINPLKDLLYNTTRSTELTLVTFFRLVISVCN